MPLLLAFLTGISFDLITSNKIKKKIMILTKAYPVNRSINSVFDDLFSFPSTLYKDGSSQSTAAVNIDENENGFNLHFNVPGRNKEDFKISADRGLLTVSYEKKEEAEAKETKSIRKEFSSQNFKRSFTLNEKVNVEGIEAKYENGILKVFLPKKEEVKITPKQISIQ